VRTLVRYDALYNVPKMNAADPYLRNAALDFLCALSLFASLRRISVQTRAKTQRYKERKEVKAIKMTGGDSIAQYDFLRPARAGGAGWRGEVGKCEKRENVASGAKAAESDKYPPLRELRLVQSNLLACEMRKVCGRFFFAGFTERQTGMSSSGRQECPHSLKDFRFCRGKYCYPCFA